MAKCCPRTCGRLATAAIFISVGVVQVIAGIILLRSKYSSMLFAPNIWTALSNIAVGILLGIASTVWKKINKNSTRHANRRKLLAALVSSILILNATTAAMLIIGDGQKLLAIYLEKGGTLEKEILAYAYTSSVCSPIVCIVVSIAFLTGICFRQKGKDIKTLDYKNVFNEDSSQLYDWVYTSNLPKPDPEILKNALSSESESSSGSESDSSSDLPVPIHLRSRSSLDDIKNSQHVSLQNRSLPFSAARNKSPENYSYPDFNETKSLPRLNKSSLLKTPIHSLDESRIAHDNGSSARKLAPSMVQYRSVSRPGTPIRIGSSNTLEKSKKPGTPNRIGDSSNLYENSRLGTPVRIDTSSSIIEESNNFDTPLGTGASNVLDKSACLPNFHFNSSFSPCPKAKLSFSTISQGTPLPAHMINQQRKGLVRNDPSVSRQSSTESEGSVQESSELSFKSISYSPNPHSIICRTSTSDQTKVQKELENLDNSAIHFDGRVNAFKEVYLDDSLPEVTDEERLSSFLTDSVVEEKNDSLRSAGDLSIMVRNSNFRKKLSSRLVPATGPVISDNHGFYKTSNRKSRKGRIKPYSKSKEGYDKYLQTGFSSFREQIDEVDATKQNSSLSKSLMTSISEKPSEEESDSFLPSTSTHSSGYMSVSYGESDDESKATLNINPVPVRQPLSPAQKLITEEIQERHRRRADRVSFELDNDR